MRAARTGRAFRKVRDPANMEMEFKMTQDQISTTVSAFESAVNGGDMSAARALFAKGFVDHDPWPGHSPDVDGFQAGLAEMREAFPDLRVEVLRSAGKEDMLAWHFEMSGTHLGDFMGFAPTGRAFRIKAMDMLRMENGRVAEHWGVIDSAAMMEQLALQ